MARQDDPYLEVYWRLADEYPEVWDDDHALAWYVRLLRAAEAAWPTAPDTPAGIPPKTWSLLVSVELIEPTRHGRRYRVRGLDKKRNARSTAASIAARSRWRNETGNASGTPDGNAEVMPHNRAEQSRTSKGSKSATHSEPRARVLMADGTRKERLS
jgi:hypothetical protein